MDRETLPHEDSSIQLAPCALMRTLPPQSPNVGTPKAGLLGGLLRGCRVPCVLHPAGLRFETSRGMQAAGLHLCRRLAVVLPIASYASAERAREGDCFGITSSESNGGFRSVSLQWVDSSRLFHGHAGEESERRVCDIS